MSNQDRRRAQGLPPCRTVGSDDGIDPRYYFRPERNDAGQDRKTRQLCAQVAQAVQLTLSGSLQDPLLQSLLVIDVEPAPDARRVRVRVHATETDVSPLLVQQRVDAAAARIRVAVAQAVHRKRVPLVVFQVDLPGADA